MSDLDLLSNLIDNDQNIIDLDEVEMLMSRRAAINKIDVREAILVRNNKVVKVDKETREGWRFTGLNTIDFADAMSHEFSRE